MSKEMMNIDDFVRERLGMHSEKEDPNAWLKMKALLDEEMPERAVPFYFRLRKPLAFMGVALLLGALCVGGYEVSGLRSRRAGSPGGSAEMSSSVRSAASGNGIAPAASQNNNNNSTTAPVNSPITPSADENRIADAGNPTRSTNAHTNVGNHLPVSPDHHRQPDHAKNKEAHSAPVNPTPEHNTVTASAQPDGVVADNTLRKIRQAIDLAKQSGAATTTEKQSTAATAESYANSDAPGAVTGKQIAKQTTAAAHNKRHPAGNIAQAGKPTTASGSDKPVQPNSSVLPEADNASAQDARRRDSMNTLSVVNKPVMTDRRSKTVSFVTDTVQESKIALPETPSTAAENKGYAIGNTEATPDKKELKQAEKESKKVNKTLSQTEAKHQADVFNGATPKGLSTADNTVAASAQNTTVSGKRKNAIAKFIEQLDIPGKAEEAKRSVRNADYYFGFSAGGNYSLSSANEFKGFQFGPTGEIVFNKRWSFFAALRYFNRSGANHQVNDNYSKEVSSNVADSIRGANYYFTIFNDSTSRHFTFSTVQSLELPLTFRYAIRNFYLMTGMNVVFTLPVNVELYEKNEGVQSSRVIATNSTNKPILEENSGTYSTKDFKGRLGLGYIVGAGYRFAPAWHADLQLTNTFWDASGQATAKEVSKNFFRIPSVQLSIGFQFNRGSKRTTFGPTDNQTR
ncbi:hypothetical protein [Rurimicrobium arvi]|uniref:Outer membrane protein beta-barrel domain-containing protein n=1 Tax=Rurimicrobium arvi TaxID=2049916 RepID=A0ABP8MNP3_9BACT